MYGAGRGRSGACSGTVPHEARPVDGIFDAINKTFRIGNFKLFYGRSDRPGPLRQVCNKQLENPAWVKGRILESLRAANQGTAGQCRYNGCMAKLTLVYGMRLLPEGEVTEVGEAPIKLANGRTAHVTMHVLEGSKEEIEAQLRQSVEAFFDLYPEI